MFRYGLYSGTYSSILPVTGQSVVALGQGFVIRNGGDNATPAIPLNAMRKRAEQASYAVID